MNIFNLFKRSGKRSAKPNNQRQPLLMRSLFNAASSDRLNASWTTEIFTADQLIYDSLQKLRARAREQYSNNDYVKRFTGLCRNNIIGHEGINVKSKVVDFSDKPDDLVRKAINSAWHEFCELEQFGTDLVELQSLCMNSLSIDGEVFIVGHINRETVIGYEVVDAHLCDVMLNKELKNGNLIRFGIEFDSSSNPVNYYFKKPAKNTVGQTNEQQYTIVSADRVRHAFIKEWPGQKRGIPWVATGLQRMKMLTAFEDAALVAARVGASKMGFFKNSKGDAYDGEQDDDGGIVMNVEPGTFEDIGNKDFQSFDPDYPKGEFAEFTSACLRGISAGLNIDHHSVSNDMRSVNYSSARIAQLETRETWKALQSWFIRKVMKPIYLEWLELSYDFGRITILSKQGQPKQLNRPIEYYRPAVFTGRRWDWVDPQKEINAKKTAIEIGITSLSAVIRERGEDPDQVFKEIADERELLKSMGFGPINSTINKEESDDDSQD